ncbi:MAG: hypothetical protein D6806_00280, partial [Deltaproteobacteria bacterium]
TPPFEQLEQRTLLEMLADVREVLEANGDGDKPLWITEIGWPVHAAVSEQQQAMYLSRAYLLALSAGVEKICWYTLEDEPGHVVEFEDTFGLLPHDDDPTDGTVPEPKPSWRALKALADLLGGTRFDVDMSPHYSLPHGVHLLRFATPDRARQVLAAWCEESQYRLSVEPDDGYRWEGWYDFLGAPLEGGGDELILTERPVYLVESRLFEL